MAFATDTRFAGFLGPQASPQPAVDDAWENFLHDVIAGITGLDPMLVRPRWQPEPPDMPDFDVDWMAFGITDAQFDFEPALIQYDDGNSGHGQELLQEHEVDTVMCSFYGPNGGRYASYLRRGLFIWQNRAVLRANACGIVEIATTNRAPEYIREQWLNRIDMNVILRREIRYLYNVNNIVRAVGTMIGNGPDYTIEVDIDTDNVPHPEEY